MGEKYPNIEALAQGCVSTPVTDWVQMRPEAEDLLAEVKWLKAIVSLAKEMRLYCLGRDASTKSMMASFDAAVQAADAAKGEPDD